MAEAGALEGDSEMRGRRSGRLRMWVRRLGLALLVFLVLPYLVVPLYRFLDPPFSMVMLEDAVTERMGIHKSWVGLDHISPRLVRAVLASEDARFCSHHGIDWIEMQNAMEDEDGPRRGASTITMQVARNLFLWGGRSWIRKGLEAPLALYTDFMLPKRRILEIYLNIAKWAPGVYGIGEASERKFGIPAANLTATQSALFAATLPDPDDRDPAKPGPGLSRLARRIMARALRLGPADDCIFG